ncbi:jg7259 [Pararge aegeria aegeria]|uniref:Jg7259 protein n=1 Tax=Pararge aegeria aegeria TaxID=348720 RepID=A0A8S4S7Y0_9NEOP|nr:jg7259 [Pararge aegeria aegeria]
MSTKDGGPVICNSCNAAISGRIVTALNKKWHPEHFTCNTCRKPIDGAKFHQHDGGVHCVPCYSEHHSPRCHGCGDPITDILLLFAEYGKLGLIFIIFPDVICPPSWGPTYAAFNGTGSPFQHIKSPTSIGTPIYGPRPLPLQLRDSLNCVGNSSSSTDLLISDLIT